MAEGRVQGRVFGEVVDEYDRIRPGYPAGLVEDVLAYASLGDAPALEIGAGTGKATVPFAERGVRLVATEPDEAMAAVLARRIGNLPEVDVVVTSLEDYIPDRSYGLLFSAQAWHWTDPAVRWQRAAAALAPGGALALFWNADRPADPDVSAAVVEVHRQLAPHVNLNTEQPDADTLAAVWPRTELNTLPEFSDLREALYTAQRPMSKKDYLALLSTHSAYRMLDEASRSRLVDALAGVLDDEITLAVDTVLYLARRTAVTGTGLD